MKTSTSSPCYLVPSFPFHFSPFLFLPFPHINPYLPHLPTKHHLSTGAYCTPLTLPRKYIPPPSAIHHIPNSKTHHELNPPAASYKHTTKYIYIHSPPPSTPPSHPFLNPISLGATRRI